MADKLTASDISEITRQADVLSKPLRDNFTNLKNKVNETIDDLAAVAIGTTNAETTAARPYHTNLKERLDSNWSGRYNYLKSGGTVTAQSPADMTVAVAAGEAKINGIDVKWAGQNSGTITAPGSNTRIDLVVANSDNTISVVTGAAAGTPVFPSKATTQIVLAALLVKSSTTSLVIGTEIFAMKNYSNPYFPNIYINTPYTATNKKHNNVIVDLISAEITGTLECQGNCWVIEYENTGLFGDPEVDIFTNEARYNDGTNWAILNDEAAEGGNSITGSSSGGSTPQNGSANAYAAPTNGGSLNISAYNIYINDIDLTGSGGGSPDSAPAERDQNDTDASFPDEDFYVGGQGQKAGNAGDVTLIAINEIEILTGGTVDLSASNGGAGGNASSGAVGNLGGKGADGGDGGDLTYTAKTYTNNGTLTQTAGSGGAGGTGSGGSDANGNGTAGSAGSAGSINATLYSFTTGLPSTYADWIHPLYLELEF